MTAQVLKPAAPKSVAPYHNKCCKKTVILNCDCSDVFLFGAYKPFARACISVILISHLTVL